MTHDTREVEGMVKGFEETWSDFIGDIEFNDAFKHLADDPDVPFVLPEMCKWLRTTLHHQLQKAREEESDRIVAIINDIDAPEGAWREALTGFKKVLVSAINHSELDQDNK